MGVYVKGMEMPKDKPLIIKINPDGAVSSTFDNDYRKYEAVPVPPHGRLGDLDELAKQIEHDRYHHTHTDGLAVRHHIAEYGHFLKKIADTPTIIPAEESET